MQSLARQLVEDGIHRVSGKIEGDESYLDSLRGEPSSGYALDPYLEGVLSGLAFNRGETGGYHGAHAPAEYAAHELALALRADHVSVAARGRRGEHAGGGGNARDRLLAHDLPAARAHVAAVRQLLRGDAHQGPRRPLRRRRQHGGGRKVVRSTIASLLGIHPHVVDGSGLSREDLTAPEQVVALLRYLSSSPLGPVVRDALAVAGHTGTLSDRMLHSAAAGRCRAKTGTLTGVSNLAGYCEAANGHLVAFAFFNDGIAVETARLLQDNMAITIARY